MRRTSRKLSIQEVVHCIDKLLLGHNGALRHTADALRVIVERRTVLEGNRPLTYNITITCFIDDDSIKRHYLIEWRIYWRRDYGDVEFEAHLISFLETSPVSVTVRSYNSFGDIRGTEIYIPTLLELSQIPNMSHAMLCRRLFFCVPRQWRPRTW
ncbi:unnamed protein product [Arabidopsis lyrata]|uniref:Predicted protein n=1 Tax=Arabidopsis lyrata subsp. lyrata TaxID=81972 RepID=D7LQC6_ARALL|nr:predicted protein [Arabidopsis lyrata subsp. lyrata]CAH8266575.1 unnamed protein product [Arabidopsis lyrata]